MARPAYTHEQLLYAYGRQKVALERARRKTKEWRDRAYAAEKKFDGYAFIDKKPDYLYSYLGLLIFRRFYRLNGMEPVMMELIIVMSYQEVFLLQDFKLYKRNWFNISLLIAKLVKRGYAVKIKVPGKSKIKMRNGYTLTQRGKDLEKDYERFYDEKLEESRAGKFSHFNFEDGAYFRKQRFCAWDRRIEQGGGKLNRAKVTDMWRDIVPIEQDKDRENGK